MKNFMLLLTGILLASGICAQVKLPSIFGDHMVLQRSAPIPVWGWASPNEKITVRFKDQVSETMADKYGKWRINLNAEPAGGPYDLLVQGKNQIVFHDVLIGEVWLCSGQSNMEFALSSVRNAEAEILNANYPEIRHIKVPIAVSGSPEEDIRPASWNVCTPTHAKDFSAVGYFFARELVRKLHVPVGLINSTWGGTMVETWTSRGAFEKSPEFKSMIAGMPQTDFSNQVKQKEAEVARQIASLMSAVHDTIPESQWKNPDYNSQGWPKISVAESWENQPLGLGGLDGIVWYRRELIIDSGDLDKNATLSLGKIDDFDETFINGIAVGSTKNYAADRVYIIPPGVLRLGKNTIAVRVEDTGGGGGFYGDSSLIRLVLENQVLPLGDHWNFRIAKKYGTGSGVGPNEFPTLLYNAMIHPLIPFGIRGVLWYQGEANAERAYQYRQAFPLMIADWRKGWGQGNFPFYFVQLASWNAANGNSEKGSTWAELREAQTLTLSLPATGMSVTTDIGESNDIHPKNKQDVGYRLAAIALNNLYNLPAEYSGPVYQSQKTEGNKVVLTFTHTGSGLMVKDKYGYIKGFEIAGADRHFKYAKAILVNNQIIVSEESISDPVAVRYNWADDAADGNLYNKEGFPALPFRTDAWKGITDDKKYAIGK